MFKFFTDKKWHLWSIGGTILILAATWYQVQLDVRINEWFGEFYDTLQKALAEPGAVTEKEFIAYFSTMGHRYHWTYHNHSRFFDCAIILENSAG